MRKGRNTLAIRFTKVAAKLLCDFANTRPTSEAFQRFETRWGLETSTGWVGTEEDFFRTLHTVREIWEGKMQDAESSIIKHHLFTRPEYEGSSLSLIEINWKASELRVAPRDLNDYVWLTLLQYSSQLAICANRDGGCVTPYFIRKRPGYKYCSDVCAKPAQQAFKRQWWNEHGEEWRQERLQKKRRRKRKSANG